MSHYNHPSYQQQQSQEHHNASAYYGGGGGGSGGGGQAQEHHQYHQSHEGSHSHHAHSYQYDASASAQAAYGYDPHGPSAYSQDQHASASAYGHGVSSYHQQAHAAPQYSHDTHSSTAYAAPSHPAPPPPGTGTASHSHSHAYQDPSAYASYHQSPAHGHAGSYGSAYQWPARNGWGGGGDFRRGGRGGGNRGGRGGRGGGGWNGGGGAGRSRSRSRSRSSGRIRSERRSPSYGNAGCQRLKRSKVPEGERDENRLDPDDADRYGRDKDRQTERDTDRDRDRGGGSSSGRDLPSREHPGVCANSFASSFPKNGGGRSAADEAPPPPPAALQASLNDDDDDDENCDDDMEKDDMDFEEGRGTSNAPREKSVGAHFDRLQQLPVSAEIVGGNITQEEKEKSGILNAFDDAKDDLGDVLCANLSRGGFSRPTPVQAHSFRHVLAGRDMVVAAQTGCGKTLAFLLPVITALKREGPFFRPFFPGKNAQAGPIALILCPTRELCVQTNEQADALLKGTDLTSAAVYGGEALQTQVDQLSHAQTDILVATPGRLVDLTDTCKVSLMFVCKLILDEADVMFSLGLEKQLRIILDERDLPEASSRQTLLFSATFPAELRKMMEPMLRTPFLRLTVGSPGATKQIRQVVKEVDDQAKLSTCLVDIPAFLAAAQDQRASIEANSASASPSECAAALDGVPMKVIVFVGKRSQVTGVVKSLQTGGVPTGGLHGKQDQATRLEVVTDFRQGKFLVLVATSVAARGLDFPDIGLVVNYDLPDSVEQYTHRIGRTGRIGKEGLAISYFGKRDGRLRRPLVTALQNAGQVVPDFLAPPPEREMYGGGFGHHNRYGQPGHHGHGGGPYGRAPPPPPGPHGGYRRRY